MGSEVHSEAYGKVRSAIFDAAANGKLRCNVYTGGKHMEPWEFKRLRELGYRVEWNGACLWYEVRWNE